MNKQERHPSLPEVATEEDGSYTCPACGEYLHVDLDVFVKGGRPAIAVRLECEKRSQAAANGKLEDAECSFVTDGVLETKALE